MDHFWGTPTVSFGAATFVIRSPRAGNESFIREVQQAVWDVDPSLPVAQIRTLGDVYSVSLARPSFTLTMLLLAGAMGLLLGFVGIYGVVAYDVSQRTREIGIRLALGARAGELKRMFVQHGLALAGIGIVAGAAATAGHHAPDVIAPLRCRSPRPLDLWRCCGGCADCRQRRCVPARQTLVARGSDRGAPLRVGRFKAGHLHPSTMLSTM